MSRHRATDLKVLGLFDGGGRLYDCGSLEHLQGLSTAATPPSKNLL